MIRKVSLTSKFMMSQPGLQAIARHIIIAKYLTKTTRPFSQLIENSKYFSLKIMQKVRQGD